MRHDKQSILLFTVLLPASCAAPPLEPMASVSWVPEEISVEDLVAEGAGQQAEAGQRFPLDLRTLLKLAGDKTLAVQMARTQAQAAAAEESRAFSKWLPTLRPRLSFYRHEGEIQDTGGAFFGVDKQNAFGGGAVDLSLDLADAYYQNISTAQRKRAPTSPAPSATLRLRLAQQPARHRLEYRHHAANQSSRPLPVLATCQHRSAK